MRHLARQMEHYRFRICRNACQNQQNGEIMFLVIMGLTPDSSPNRLVPFSKSANLMYISYTDVDVHEWSSAYLRICEAFRFIHIDGLFMGQTSEVPKSCHLDKVQYNPLQLYIRNHLAIFYIPFRLHVHLYIQLWEKKLKLKIRFCEFIHCREVLQTSEPSLMPCKL